MHPYIPHLIADIEAAHRKDAPQEKEEEKTMEEYFEEIDRWVSGVDERPFSYYCGLTTDIFPPPQQLTEHEMEIVNQAFLEMTESWNLWVDLPKNLPVAFAYDLLVNLLNRETMIPNEGFVGFDFCTGYAPDCELKEYCPCLKIWNSPDSDDDFQNEKADKDFP